MTDMRMEWPRHQLIMLVAGVLVGTGASYFFISYVPGAQKDDCSQKYFFTNQDLDCDTYDSSATRLGNLGDTLTTAITLYVQQHKASRIAIWVRDLTSKQWAAVNENDQFSPASLLKVPLMITYFKLAEIEPSLLDTQVVYTNTLSLNNNSQDFEPSRSPLVVGKSYSTKELISAMIIYSDNNAAAVLLNRLDPNIFNNTLVDLGLKLQNDQASADIVTAKNYAGIFRSLYNASYLNRYYAQEALELMASSTYKAVAIPLPAGVSVADKFGQREVDNADGSVQKRELHDCGLVYKQERPYTICIMTEGSDYNTLQSVISDLSKIVYDRI